MDKARGNNRAIPGFIRPMLCKTVGELPRGDEWVYEVKRGGRRTIAVKNGRCVKLYRANGERLNCPAVEQTLRNAPPDKAVIDGEIISVESHDGGEEDGPLQLFAWDLLHLNGRDITRLPVERRKQQLCTVTLDSEVLFSPSLECEPSQLIEEVSQLSLEAVVAKRKGSIYEPGRCPGSWMKLPVTASPCLIDRHGLPAGSER